MSWRCCSLSSSVSLRTGETAPEIREGFEKRLTLRSPAEPREIADAIAFVMSDKAGYMAGAVMNMMGGLDLFVS
jgi:NAD(P)-dependent dehydrogenase (short-subunit alcohol dehydrogenase family)